MAQRRRGGFVTYRVPRHTSQTVLDVVIYIQRELQPDLGYRYACRVGMCGSCAMTVNGKARWTCRTHVSKVAADGRLEVAPLSNLPVIEDLVTDMSENFFDKWNRMAKGSFTRARCRAARRFRSRAAGIPARRRGRWTWASNASDAARLLSPSLRRDDLAVRIIWARQR